MALAGYDEIFDSVDTLLVIQDQKQRVDDSFIKALEDICLINIATVQTRVGSGCAGL